MNKKWIQTQKIRFWSHVDGGNQQKDDEGVGYSNCKRHGRVDSRLGEGISSAYIPLDHYVGFAALTKWQLLIIIIIIIFRPSGIQARHQSCHVLYLGFDCSALLSVSLSFFLSVNLLSSSSSSSSSKKMVSSHILVM